MRYLFIFGFGLTLLLAGLHAGASENLRISFDAESQKDIQKGLIDQQIRIMPQLNALNIGSGWSNNLNFYYEKSLSKIFFQDHIIDAKITDIDFDGANITLKLFHPVYGFGNITFLFNENFIARTSDDTIEGILQNTLGDGNHRYVFSNPESRRYHLFSCLHSGDNSHLIRMSRAEADNQGYQPGGFCFKKVVYLPDLAIERRIEIQWLARLREHALLMGVSPKQDALNKLGRQILQNWPIQLLGYNYSFHLIYSQRMITMATPTGKIFIATALMDALESEQEVEALLARAIAHVENRHSLKQYYSKTKADKNEQFIQTLTSAAGSFAGIFAGAASGAIKAFGNLPFLGASNDNPSSLGYEIDLEKEADTVAALYFDCQQKDKRHLSAAIKKLELAPLYVDFENEERFDLNAALSNFEINKMTKQLFPGGGDQTKDVRINDRAKRVQDLKFIYFNEDSSFVLQKGRRLPVQLAMKYQSLAQDENKVMVYISDKSFLPNLEGSNNPSQVTLFVTDRHGKHRFKLLWRYITEDMWGARLIFEAPRERRGRFLEGVQDLEIEILKFQGPADKGNDRKITKFNFVKGRLDPENRMADLHQSDS
jgi:Zn-dependent protease with chaperone function